jgi:hypothetical protein
MWREDGGAFGQVAFIKVFIFRGVIYHVLEGRNKLRPYNSVQRITFFYGNLVLGLIPTDGEM